MENYMLHIRKKKDKLCLVINIVFLVNVKHVKKIGQCMMYFLKKQILSEKFKVLTIT